jgi:predicted amidohydrolase YtcJ
MRIGPRMWHRRLYAALPVLAVASALSSCTSGTPSEAEADLLLVGGTVWTGWDELPRAEAVAVRGDRIVAVGTYRDLKRFRGRNTRVLDLKGRFIAPGFIDNHTHFDAAGALLLGLNLLQVKNEAQFIDEVRGARDRLPDGAWITGGDWGAYEEWPAGSAGGEGLEAQDDGAPAEDLPFVPHREMIDSITVGTPVLISKWDGSVFLANELALQRAGATCAWSGVECEQGRTTGRLTPEAAGLVRAAVTPKTTEQRVAESRLALQRLRESGVTTIHDITPAEQMTVFQTLLSGGEMTVRVYARPTLDRWWHLASAGIQHGFGNDWLKVGGLKGFVDGIMGNSTARFYEPYLTSGEVGRWRTMMDPPGNMQRLLISADSAGHWPQVHAIGDHAIDTLLTMFERTAAVNGPADRRFRVIHAQVLRGPETAERMADLGVIAEVQPYHAIDDMRWMEQRIGERARWAYAFRTLHEAGVRLSFGSDWPGTNASWYPASPLLGLYAAVTRQTLGGEPEEGWFPEERVDLETALRAYTINNAFAAGEEDIKGSIEPGKLADLVVVDRDLFSLEPEMLKNCRILYTIVGGRIVYQRIDLEDS